MPTALKRRSSGRCWDEERDGYYRKALIEDPAGSYAKRLTEYRGMASRTATGTWAGRRSPYPLLCCEAELWNDEGVHASDCPAQA